MSLLVEFVSLPPFHNAVILGDAIHQIKKKSFITN